MSDTVAEAMQNLTEVAADLGIAPANGKRPDPDAWRAIEAERLTEAEKELARDQKALEAAIAKVADLKAEVAFDEMKVASRKAGLVTFDRLHAKAAK